jgi:hypothetical protein
MRKGKKEEVNDKTETKREKQKILIIIGNDMKINGKRGKKDEKRDN